MDSNVEQVIQEALALTPEEQSEVIAVLRNKLREDDVDEAAIETAWLEESRRRMQEIRSGEVVAVPWEEAKARLLSL